MAALLRSRPHWTLGRLVARLMGRTGGRIELFLGSVDLAATVEITLGLLSAPAWRSVLRIAQGICGDDPFSARRLAMETGSRFSDAEQVLEEAVEIRVADPVVGANGERCYRMNLIYRLAMVDWIRRGEQQLVSGSRVRLERKITS